MLPSPGNVLAIAVALIAFAIASRIFIPRDLPWRIPGGVPLRSVYCRPDVFAFRLFFSAGCIAGTLALGQRVSRLQP